MDKGSKSVLSRIRVTQKYWIWLDPDSDPQHWHSVYWVRLLYIGSRRIWLVKRRIPFSYSESGRMIFGLTSSPQYICIYCRYSPTSWAVYTVPVWCCQLVSSAGRQVVSPGIKQRRHFQTQMSFTDKDDIYLTKMKFITFRRHLPENHYILHIHVFLASIILF